MNDRGFTLVELIVVVVILGILAAITIFNFVGMQTRAKEASVKANCHTVQLAAEDFAIQNDGSYPGNVNGDTTPVGDTLLDLMPGGVPLENPFTKMATEPVDGAAANPGETGYVVLVDGFGLNSGYTITGFGRNVQIIVLANGI